MVKDNKKKTVKNPDQPTGEQIQKFREILVECLNHWKVQMKDPSVTTEIKDIAFTRCFHAVRLLLNSYGPVPGADDEFMKFLLIVESYQQRNNSVKSTKIENDTPISEGDSNKVINNEKKRNITLDQIFS